MLEQLQPTPQNEQTYNINYATKKDPQQEQTYNINYATKKDPQQDYSGFGYALNNLFRGGGINNLLSPLLGGGGYNLYSEDGQPSMGGLSSLTKLLFPFMADYFWGNKYRTNDTGNTMTPNFYFPLQNQTTNNQGVNNVDKM